MKTLGKRLFGMLAIALVATFSFTSCDDDDPVIMEDSIVALAQGTPELSSLVTALTKFPDLVSLLNTDGDNTVFAPTNAAFTALLGVIGQSSIDDIPEDVLKRVLQNHVIAGATIRSTDLSDGDMAIPALGEDTLMVGVNGGTVTIGGAEVTMADVEASNGVVHIIDAVLVPGLEASIVNTVVEPAYFSKDFTTLTAAVVKAGLLDVLINPSATLTVFAPNNDAFTAAGITSLDDFTGQELVPILQYHVLGIEADLATVQGLNDGPVGTLNGDVYLSKNADGVFLNGSTQVIATDIDADNGVVHVINRTLVPASQTITEIAVAAATADPGAEFTQLVAALSAVEAGDPPLLDLVSILDGNIGAPYTVFAPTDAAFAQLYADAGVPDLDSLIATLGLGVIQEVLLYHVLNEARVFSADLPNLPSTTINPATVGNTSWTLDVSALTITETDGGGINTNNVANITGTDILATNGVIHTIDKVILP